MDLLKKFITEIEQQDNNPTSNEIYKLISQQTESPNENNNRQGIIRRVPDAHLVYKRKNANGTYEELWVYNALNIKHEANIRNAILAGTDIPPGKVVSNDEKQCAQLWAVGNVELLKITGLPN